MRCNEYILNLLEYLNPPTKGQCSGFVSSRVVCHRTPTSKGNESIYICALDIFQLKEKEIVLRWKIT